MDGAGDLHEFGGVTRGGAGVRCGDGPRRAGGDLRHGDMGGRQCWPARSSVRRPESGMSVAGLPSTLGQARAWRAGAGPPGPGRAERQRRRCSPRRCHRPPRSAGAPPSPTRSAAIQVSAWSARPSRAFGDEPPVDGANGPGVACRAQGADLSGLGGSLAEGAAVRRDGPWAPAFRRPAEPPTALPAAWAHVRGRGPRRRVRRPRTRRHPGGGLLRCLRGPCTACGRARWRCRRRCP